MHTLRLKSSSPTLPACGGGRTVPRDISAGPVVAALAAVAAAGSLFACGTAFANPFIPGDLVVYTITRSPITTALSGTSIAVELKEFNPAVPNVTVQTIGLATTGANALTASGNPAADGGLNLSADRSFLTFTGYNSPVGTAQVVTTTFSRIFATVNNLGTISYSSPYFASGENVHAVASAGQGSGFYIATSAGMGYTSSLTGTVNVITGSTDLRTASIAFGKLYATAGEPGAYGGVNAIGTGLPTGPVTINQLPGFTNVDSDQNTVRFLDLNGDSTPDTLYLAAGIAPDRGIQRWNRDPNTGNWTLAYTLNRATATGFFGLAVRINPLNPNQVDLFATTQTYAANGTSNAGLNQLVSFTDSAVLGNTTNPGDTSAVLATAAGVGQMFRGVDFAPTAIVPEPSTWALLLSGGVALFAGFWRRRKIIAHGMRA